MELGPVLSQQATPHYTRAYWGPPPLGITHRKQHQLTHTPASINIPTDIQTLWNDETRNKLYEIRPNLKESLCNTTQSLYRKQETVMTRPRIGHTWITHSYLLKKEDQPFCHACDNPFTVKHILVEWSDFTYIRNKYYTTTDVHTLFREVDSSKITEYLKEIKLFDKI